MRLAAFEIFCPFIKPEVIVFAKRFVVEALPETYKFVVVALVVVELPRIAEVKFNIEPKRFVNVPFVENRSVDVELVVVAYDA